MNQKIRKNAPAILIFLLVIALVVCFAKIRSLESDVRILRSDLVSEVRSIQNTVSSIYSNVDQKLREEASLLSLVEAQYGELNPKDHTIAVTVRVVPKLISDDMKIRISINGRGTDLTESDSIFTGTIPVDIYNQDELILLTIETDAGTQTQYLSEIGTEYLWNGRIPNLYYCDITGKATFTEGKYALNGTIDINCSPVEDTPGVRFEKFVIVTELNGQEINREDITEDVLNYEAYPHGVYWRDAYRMECEAQEGDTLCIYVEASDSLGYVHRRLLHFWKEQNGALAEAMDASEYIFDPNGVQIFP